MSIHSCWNGRAYVLFSSSDAAAAYADEVTRSFAADMHPMGYASVSELVSAGAPTWWLVPAHTREDGTFIGAQEESPCEAGDDSPEVAEAVAAFWAAREAAWNAA